MPKRISRSVALGAATLVALVGTAFVAPVANAAVTDQPLAISPAVSTDASALTLTTPSACPAGGTYVQAAISGAGFPATGQNITPVAAVSSLQSAANGGFVVQSNDILSSYAQLQTPAATFTGAYNIVVTCRAALDPTALATFTVTIYFGSDHHSYSTTKPITPTIKVVKAPVVSGKAVVGGTLKTAGSWNPSAVKSKYQWLRDGKAIKGAAKSSYKVVKADKGHKLSVRVSVSATGYIGTSATSKAVKVTK